jgi:hypothetical protein
MFSAACNVARNFTRPVIISKRFENGKVNCGLATFVVVNKEGWIVTAAHVLNAMRASQDHAQQKARYEAEVARIRNDQNLSVKQRHRSLEKIKPNPKWIINQSLWWSQDPARATQFFVDPLSDVAIAQLRDFDTSRIAVFPAFNSSAPDPAPGSSLCRLGFPFVEISAIFSEATGSFEMQDFRLPPMFPNDGIHTRIQVFVEPTNNRSVKFIETSTPGLKGQSGGPLFDTAGRLWGIQSRTQHLALGFSPKTKDDSGKDVVEHQFMNVGLATHVQHVVDLLTQHGVSYQSA